MNARLNLFGNKAAATFLKHINSAGKVVTDSGLPHATQELVKIRASQINGCGFCTDMHTKDATEAGETALRLNLIAVWREATVFTDAERAALELAEAMTATPPNVTDELFARLQQFYDEPQLVELVSIIAQENFRARRNTTFRIPSAGSYCPLPPPASA